MGLCIDPNNSIICRIPIGNECRDKITNICTQIIDGTAFCRDQNSNGECHYIASNEKLCTDSNYACYSILSSDLICANTNSGSLQYSCQSIITNDRVC